MAIVEVKVPQLSESVSEATMLQWKKKPGEAVAQDEILIEIETDKVVLEVPAPAADGSPASGRCQGRTRCGSGRRTEGGEAVAAGREGAGFRRHMAEGPPGTTRSDVASARPYRRASARVAANQRHPHDVQRSEHGAGDGPAQQVQGQIRKGTRREARLHVVLREGGRARAEEVPARERIDRR